MAALLTAAPQPVAHEAAFETFFRQNFARVYGLLFRVTGDAQDAEDLSQELFLQLARQDTPLWESPAAAGWLWKAAVHRALNELRGKRRRVAREERATRQEMPIRVLNEQDEDPAASLIRRERQQAVRRALRAMKPQESMLLLGRHSGLSYQELASALSLNPASVGTLLMRAERRFKDLYLDEELSHGTHDDD